MNSMGGYHLSGLSIGGYIKNGFKDSGVIQGIMRPLPSRWFCIRQPDGGHFVVKGVIWNYRRYSVLAGMIINAIL